MDFYLNSNQKEMTGIFEKIGKATNQKEEMVITGQKRYDPDNDIFSINITGSVKCQMK
jgi:hypothetical protein